MKMISRTSSLRWILFLLLATDVKALWSIQTLDEMVGKDERLEITLNKSYLINLSQATERISVVNPEIADVQIINPNQVLVNGIKVGNTGLIIWSGDQTRNIDLVVRHNTSEIERMLQQTMPDESIRVTSFQDSIALQGNVSGINTVNQAMEIAMAYSPNVINLLNVPGLHQVLLKVKVAEVARNFREELGFNFLITDENVIGGSLLGNLISGDFGDSQSTDVELSDAVTMFFGLQKGDVLAFIQALRRKGMIHILAEPNLIARSGETANFLVGGEYPIPVVQSGISNSITVEYKEFGVRLNFTPTLLSDGNIHLDIAPEVSDLDFANGVVFSGFTIPALATRRAHTVVSLMDGQTYAIAGLISHSKQKSKRKIPVVGDIPVFGGLFTGNEITATETELLIMVTPHIIAPLESGENFLQPFRHLNRDGVPDIDRSPIGSRPTETQPVQTTPIEPQPIETQPLASQTLTSQPLEPIASKPLAKASLPEPIETKTNSKKEPAVLPPGKNESGKSDNRRHPHLR